MKRFKSAGQAQRFLSARDGISNLLHLSRHQVPATQYRAARTQGFQVWAEIYRRRRSGVTTDTPSPIARHRDLSPTS